MASNKGLGRGLGALLGDFDEPIQQNNTPYKLLPIHKVEPNPDQPRRDFDEEELEALAESISVHGIIQPLTVRELSGGYYQIIAGERRWRAARMANLQEVPVVAYKARDIAQGMFIASKSVSGAMRKLVTDGYVEKIGQNPVVYMITEKGKNVIFENEGENE